MIKMISQVPSTFLQSSPSFPPCRLVPGEAHNCLGGSTRVNHGHSTAEALNIWILRRELSGFLRRCEMQRWTGRASWKWSILLAVGFTLCRYLGWSFYKQSLELFWCHLFGRSRKPGCLMTQQESKNINLYIKL